MAGVRVDPSVYFKVTALPGKVVQIYNTTHFKKLLPGYEWKSLFMEICCVQVLSNYLIWNFDAMAGIFVFHLVLWN